MSARVIAVANQKGGVGKSTTVVNLGAWMALDGARVLIVDLDPQANATTGVGVDPRRASGNIYRVLVEGLPVEDAIEPTAVKNLYCVPSTIDLAGAEVELVSAFSRELKLKKGLEGVLEDFDHVFIDCPPSLGLLTVNALAAAMEVLVPIQCEFYALEGLGQLLNNVTLVQSSLNPDLTLLGLVLTMHDGRTKLAEQVAAEVRGHFPGKVYASVIPRNVRLSEAPSFGQPIALYDPKSIGSRAYQALAAEVRAGSPRPQAPAVPVPAPAGDQHLDAAIVDMANTGNMDPYELTLERDEKPDLAVKDPQPHAEVPEPVPAAASDQEIQPGDSFDQGRAEAGDEAAPIPPITEGAID